MSRQTVSKHFAEFLLIVVGVLVALAVENWRADQADLKLVDSYLVSLEVELVRDTFLTRVYTNVSRERSRSLRLLLDDLAGAMDPLSPTDQLLALHWAYNDDSPLYVSSVLDELLVTGNARLLEGSVLSELQTVSDRFTISERVIAGLSFPLEARVPGLIPGHMRRALRESVRAEDRWILDTERLMHAADSLLGGGSTAEVASLQSWKSVPDIRLLLEQQAYSSAAYTEELESNQVDLLTALQVVSKSIH